MKIKPLLGIDDLMEILGLSRVSIYRKVAEAREGKSDFPLPIWNAKHRLRWNATDIEQYIQPRTAQVPASVQQGRTDEQGININSNKRGNND